MCLYMLAPLVGRESLDPLYLFEGNPSRVPPSPPVAPKLDVYSPELEVDRRCAPGCDGDLFRTRARLVIPQAAVLVDAARPEAFVPHRDLVAAGREPLDAEGAPLVGHRVVWTVVHHHPRGQVGVDVAHDAHDPRMGQSPG